MKKVAVVRRNGLGDLVCAYPLVRYLQNRGDHVTLFADSRNAPLIPYLGMADAVVVFPKHGNKYWNSLKEGFKARKNHFDLAVSAKTSPMKLVDCFLFALGAKERIAPASSTWHAKLLTKPVAYDPKILCHQALKALKIFEPHWNEVPDDLHPRAFVSEQLKLQYVPECQRRPTILLSATTTNPLSRLSPEHYASVLNHVHKTVSFSVFIIAQEQDQMRAKAILNQLNMDAQIHFPRNFEEFMVLLDTCHLFFVGDGGIAHIGAALGKEVVVLFGGVNPIEWSPLGKKVKTLYHPEHVNLLSEERLYQTLVGGHWMK